MVSFERDSPCTRVRATARATGAMDSLVEDISRDSSARVPKWYANAQTLHFTEEAKRVSLSKNLYDKSDVLAATRVLLNERKKKGEKNK